MNKFLEAVLGFFLPGDRAIVDITSIEYEQKLINDLNYHNAEVVRLIEKMRELTYSYKAHSAEALDRMEEQTRRYRAEYCKLRDLSEEHRSKAQKIAQELNDRADQGISHWLQQDRSLL